MTITDRTRKLLWGRAAGCCSFPNCRRLLFSSPSGPDSPKALGDEAHVYARSVDGPRGDLPGAPDDRDSYENLILLCKYCHGLVDTQPTSFPPASLLSIKRHHETWVRELISARLVGLAPVDDPHRYQGTCNNLPVGQVWANDQRALVTCVYGSNPLPVGGNRWRASGVNFHLVSVRDGVSCVFGSSEAEHEVDYWCTDDSLHVIQYRYDPESDQILAFVERVFNLSVTPIEESLSLLIRIKSEHEIADLAAILGKPSDQVTGSEIEITLLKLRNAGLVKPAEAENVIRQHFGAWWYDGSGAETADGVLEDLAIARKAKKTG